MSMKKIPNQSKEAGLVAIIVTMILMIVISLITIGFARLVRREQIQALDRQLSTQDFYSADVGVNNLAVNPILDSASNTSYSCLLVDASHTSLVYDNVDATNATVIPLIAKAGTISSITLNWQDTTGSTSLNCSYALGLFPAIN